MNSNHPLEQLRAELAEPEDGYLNPQQYARLSTVEYDSRLHVDFYGKPFDETFHRLSEILRSPEVAIVLASLTLRCPDEGMNGACNWDLGTLLHGDAQFPELRHFSIQQVSPSDHNRIIVASEFEEAGMLGQLLRKSPALDSLITPSAPDASFFEVRDHPLRYLNVDAGFDTQSFIANLAGSPCFPGLKSPRMGRVQRDVHGYASGRLHGVRRLREALPLQGLRRLERIHLAKSGLHARGDREPAGPAPPRHRAAVQDRPDFIPLRLVQIAAPLV
jgi:hypothetical protein